MTNKSVKTLTLISGNQVMVEQEAEHINICHPVYDEYHQATYRNIEKQGEQYVFPEELIPFIPGKLDCGLFNISKMVANGYTDDKMDYIPMHIMCNDIIAQGRVNFALESKVIHKRELSSIHTVSVRVAKVNISPFINVFFDVKENKFQENTLLEEDVAQIKLDEMISIMN